jgi:uncharacterized protein YutE (UPF0331/DUF86 family)
MSREVRLQKIDSIVRCLARLEEKKPTSLAQFKTDIDAQDIIMINLERLVQSSVDAAAIYIAEKSWGPMPDTMAGVFEILRLKGLISEPLAKRLMQSVGFRNIAVHEYDKIDWSIVFKVLKVHLDDFRKLAQILAK